MYTIVIRKDRHFAQTNYKSSRVGEGVKFFVIRYLSVTGLLQTRSSTPHFLTYTYTLHTSFRRCAIAYRKRLQLQHTYIHTYYSNYQHSSPITQSYTPQSKVRTKSSSVKCSRRADSMCTFCRFSTSISFICFLNAATRSAR